MAIDAVKIEGQVDVDASKAEAELLGLDAAAHEAAKDRTAHITYDVDRSPLDRAESAMADFIAAMRAASDAAGDLESAAGGAGNNLNNIGSAASSSSGAMGGMLATAGTLGLKIGAIAELAPLAASGITALAGAAVGAVSAIGPLVGLLGVLPGAFAALGAGLGAGILGFQGIGQALGDYNKAQTPAVGAANSMKDAAWGLSQALYAQAQAQRALNEFVKQYPENTDKKQLAYRDAVLGQKQAVLDLQKAQLRLTDIQKGLGDSLYKAQTLTDEFTGKVYEVAVSGDAAAQQQLELKQAHLDVARAQDNVTAANFRVTDSQRDLNKFTAHGMKNTREYKDLLHALVVAQHGVAQAQRAQSMAGSGSAMAQYANDLKKLSPAGQEFVRFLTSLKPKLDELRKTAQQGLLPGLEKGIKAALPLFPILNKHIGSTARLMGNFGNNLGHLIGSKSFAKDLGGIMKANEDSMRSGSRGLVSFASGLRHVAVAAKPLVRFMGNLFEEMGNHFDLWAKTGRESGRLGTFFQHTEDTINDLVKVFGNLWHTFGNVLRAAYPLGEWMRKTWVDGTQRMADATDRNFGKMQSWFNSLKAPIHAMSQLFKGLGTTIFHVGTKQMGGFTATVNEITTKFLPMLQHALEGLDTKQLGPAIVDMFTSIGKAIGALLGHDEVLLPFIKVIGTLANVLADFIEKVPSPVLTALLTALATFKISHGVLGGLNSMAGGLGKVFGLLSKMKNTGILSTVGSGLFKAFPNLAKFAGKAGLGGVAAGAEGASGALGGLGASLAGLAGPAAIAVGATAAIVGGAYAISKSMQASDKHAQHWARSLSNVDAFNDPKAWNDGARAIEQQTTAADKAAQANSGFWGTIKEGLQLATPWKNSIYEAKQAHQDLGAYLGQLYEKITRFHANVEILTGSYGLQRSKVVDLANRMKIDLSGGFTKVNALFKLATRNTHLNASAMQAASDAYDVFHDSTASMPDRLKALSGLFQQLTEDEKGSSAETDQARLAINDLGNEIKGHTIGAFKGFTDQAINNRNAIRQVRDDIYQATQKVYEITGSADKASQKFRDLTGVLRDQLSKQLGISKSDAQKLLDKFNLMPSALKGIIDTVPNFNKALGNLGYKAGEVKDALKGVSDEAKKIAYFLLGGGGTPTDQNPQNLDDLLGVKLPKNKTKALGGMVAAGTPYLVGERRPEVFVPNVSGRIIPTTANIRTGGGIDNGQLEKMLGRLMEAIKPNVKIDQTYNEKADPRAIAAELAWRLG